MELQLRHQRECYDQPPSRSQQERHHSHDQEHYPKAKMPKHTNVLLLNLFFFFFSVFLINRPVFKDRTETPKGIFEKQNKSE